MSDVGSLDAALAAADSDGIVGLASGAPVWIRSAGAHDWPAIGCLESETYGEKDLSEGLEKLRSRAHPATSFVLDAGDRIGGYLLALPYPRFRFPDLSLPEAATVQSSNLHLHDIVIGADFRGRGWGRSLVRQLTRTARSLSYECISLVSVGGTAGFWLSQGFRPHPEVAVSGSYGPDAVYMSRNLDR
jgi:ornithine decarboxylase